jgi:hypothetical protein
VEVRFSVPEFHFFVHQSLLDMDTSTSATLETEYSHWQRNNNILREIRDGFSRNAGESAQWKAALENALMYVVLKNENDKKDLMSKVDHTALRHGLECVDLGSHANEEVIDKLVEIIQRNITLEKDSSQKINLSPHIRSNRYEVGDFSMDRNSYTDKAYDFLCRKSNEEDALRQLLTTAIRYASIYAETRHIGPPQKVYDAFYNWGIRNEGFASPFNARLLGKESARFYSLFPDTDAPFGSGGSFFQLAEPKNPGHWSLDPPFLPETMNQVDEKIRKWQEKYPNISILYIIPESHVPANTPDETVVLTAHKHYYEGLDGEMSPLPVNVCIHRYGEIEGFSAELIREGYTP